MKTSECYEPNDVPLELTILMPCLNESKSIGICVTKALSFIASHNIAGEVVVADNGSTDGSQKIAHSLGARVIDVPLKGYGAAISHGIACAKGKYIIMGDSDDSYDFSYLMPFVEKLREDYDLVMGNRFKGEIESGAMPFLHRYLGNPVLSFIGRLFFGSNCGDFHCGLRGFKRDSILALDLRTTGMEFASEMVVRSTLNGLNITEVPTTLSKDKRGRPPHLNTWRDGWRHLRFLLMFSPRWLFFYPGTLLIAFGLLGMLVLMPGALNVGGITFDVHTLMLSGIFIIIGCQVLVFAFLAKHYCVMHGLHPTTPRIEKISRILTLEHSLLAGIVIAALGFSGIAYSAYTWKELNFGALNYEVMMREIIPFSVLTVIGLQIAFAAFLAGIFELSVSTSRPS